MITLETARRELARHKAYFTYLVSHKNSNPHAEASRLALLKLCGRAIASWDKLIKELTR